MSIPHKTLKEKQRRLREGFPQTVGLRVHRAISWIGRAEAEKLDPDATFIFQWIAFNAAYADEMDIGAETALGDRKQFIEYIIECSVAPDGLCYATQLVPIDDARESESEADAFSKDLSCERRGGSTLPRLSQFESHTCRSIPLP